MKFVWYNKYATWGRYALRRVIYSFIFLRKVYFILRKAVGFVVTLRVKPLFEGLKPPPVNRSRIIKGVPLSCALRCKK